jgi:hypothetical protein
MVPDLIEIALNLKSFSMAYYYSASLGDDAKAKIALLELEGRRDSLNYFCIYLKIAL